MGELFVIRNAGNIIPPYGATNGGEGASIEYAINALGIEQVIICGHSHCGAMKGLLKLQSLADEMPLVYDWLKQAEATRRLVKDNYKELEGEELIEVTVAENVLNQLSNLQSYPIIRSRLHQGKLSLHGWIFRIETGEILSYDPILHDFVAPHSKITHPEPEEKLPSSRHLPNSHPFKISEDYIRTHADLKKATPAVNTVAKKNGSSTQKPGYTYLEPSQADRIYRGSRS